tara:strand:- start:4353 stop:4523 length:171 start_codon:yes stop_codon:yes gene_type:complete
MSLEKLEKTLLICIEYHKKKDNPIRVKQLEAHLSRVEKSSLFCSSVKLSYLYPQTK